MGDTAVFYRRRLYRLLPMYLIAVAGVYLLSSAVGFTANMDGGYLLRSLASWLSFGFISGMTLTDGKPGWLILCGVFWTLAIEVKFYLLFPLLAMFARQRLRGMVALGAPSSCCYCCIGCRRSRRCSTVFCSPSWAAC
ncbi:acyltransferase family protein [Sodalis glossinidius]|uniref:acyltransferase family protein n=1 Tax=Sodalis glossinidius TaxID=63612 RepID=UPI00031D2E80|nr:acyltransferase family protein [Sodalis glossinidius]